MRVIAGVFGSRKLKAPEGVDTRPTADRVKEALFSMLGCTLEGARALDLYAGSGALALEAISRGAECAVLVDQSDKACRVIRENIDALGCGDKTRLMRMTDVEAIALLRREGATFTHIFLDPPYRMDAYPVVKSLLDAGILEGDGTLVIEHGAKTPPRADDRLTLVTTRRYGDTAITIYHLKWGE